MRYMRQEIEDEFGIKELQDKILQIAVYIDEVCNKIGIKYFLMGGSALGAIRHGGFIPWDDDLDIFMYPDDYEKFKKYFLEHGNKEDFYLQEMLPRDGRVLSAKLRMNNTTYIEESTKNWKIHHGIFVDIFILHNTPNHKIGSMAQCFSAKYILAKGQKAKGAKYRGIKGIFMAFANMTPKNFGIKRNLKRLYKHDKKRTNRVCHFVGKAFFKKGIYDRSIFEETERVRFENVYLNVPKDSDKYLHDRFGDYMKLPPRESIKTVQHAMKWDTENDFSVYVNQERNFSDERYLV